MRLVVARAALGVRRQPHVASRLSRYDVAVAAKGFREVAAREIPRQPHALRGDDFVVNEVEPNHSRALAVLEMAADRIANGATQLVEVVRFGDNRCADGARHGSRPRRPPRQQIGFRSLAPP